MTDGGCDAGARAGGGAEAGRAGGGRRLRVRKGETQLIAYAATRRAVLGVCCYAVSRIGVAYDATVRSIARAGFPAHFVPESHLILPVEGVCGTKMGVCGTEIAYGV
eukprot:1446342-Rhodomonas_salina.1